MFLFRSGVLRDPEPSSDSRSKLSICFFIDPPAHEAQEALLERRPARDDHADGNPSFSVESLKILQITIEERILVVPFDFEGNSISLFGRPIHNANVVHFVRD